MQAEQSNTSKTDGHEDAVERLDEPTSAWSLAAIYVVLVVYASLYPFQNWRNQELNPFEFLWAGWPRYWSGFDITANVIGYIALGFFLTLGFVRSKKHHSNWAVGVFLATLISLTMECLQSYLPARVPSIADLTFNCVGALIGSLSSYYLEKIGLLKRWSLFRRRWFMSETKGVSASLVLIALWPFSLLFPSAVPLGLGQIHARVLNALREQLVDTPYVNGLLGLEVRAQPLAPGVESVCVALGLLMPFLLGAAVIKEVWQRWIFLGVLTLSALLVTGLSSALSFGPAHAWYWLGSPWVVFGLVLGLALAALTANIEPKSSNVLLLVIMIVQLFLINQQGADVYLEQNLQTWEQGRFIRFNGLAQWMGWLWPFAVLMLIVYKLSFNTNHRSSANNKS